MRVERRCTWSVPIVPVPMTPTLTVMVVPPFWMTTRTDVSGRPRSGERERRPEALDGGDRVVAGPALQPHGAPVAHVCQGSGDGRVVDLAGARFAASRDVGDLDLADPGQGAPAELDEVPLTD